MSYKATDVVQISSPTFQGNVTARVLKVEIVTTGSTKPISLKTLYFNTRGTTKIADLSNARLFYTATNDITGQQMPSTAVELGSVIKKPNGKITFNTNRTLAPGTNYFWLTYDISTTAQPGNLIDASLDSLFVGDTMRLPSIKSPIGSRKVENYGTYCTSLVSTPNTLQNKLIGITDVKIGNGIANATADMDVLTFYPTPRSTAYRLQKIPVEIKGGKGFAEQIVGWADWNNDGFFDKNNEEILYTSKRLPPGEVYHTSFVIPCNATTGTHKIRIVSDYFAEQKPEPCHNVAFGDVEEYLIEVLDNFGPKANFVAEKPTYRSSEIIFINTSTAEGNVKYEWDYNFDGIYDETAVNGTFNYNTTGWKKIRLKLTQITCDSVITRIYTDSVNVIFPSANTVSDFISSTNSPGINEPVMLTDVSSEKPNSWRWEITPAMVDGTETYYFTNGTDTSSQNPIVVFKRAGNYTISLITSNATLKTSTETKKDYIKVVGRIRLCINSGTDTAKEHSGYIYDNGGKNAIYTVSQKCFAVIKPPCAESINLTFNSFDVSAFMAASGGDYLRVYDGIDDKGIPLHDSAGYINGFQNSLPNNTPILPPTLQAKSGTMYLEWTSDSAFIGEGFEAQWTTVLQNIAKPEALFTNADTVYELQNIHFINTSIGNDLKYFWDFDNDGQTDSTTADANFSFARAGTYTVQLIVSNCGGTDTLQKSITVLTPAAKPVADFKANFVAFREGDVVAFTDLSTNNPYHYNWIVTPNVRSNIYEFVNGTSEHSQHPQIKFHDAGLYSIRLEIANSLGSDGHTKANYIEVSSQCAPEAKSVSTDVGINSVKLTDISQKDIINQQSASGKSVFSLYSYKEPVLIETGATYKIEVKRLSTFNKIIGNVWIDFNDNGFFNDPGELVLKVDSVSGNTWGGKFTIPGAINPGISRLRVGVTYTGQRIVTCGNNNIAEFEDYTIVLSADKIKPEIILIGADTIVIEEGDMYADSGATAFDNVDGEITHKIKVTNTINTALTGTQLVTYETKDTAGNKAVKHRVIKIITDTTAPVLGLFDGDSIYVEIFNSYKEPGYFAYDNVTQQPKITVTGKIDTAKFGLYKLTYSTTDDRGNKAVKIRRVYVGDTTRPTVSFLNGNPMKWQIFRPFRDSGVVVKDNYWPENQLTTQHQINVNKAGLYTITYTARDGSGNIAVKSRQVRVGDYIPPQLVLPFDTFILDVHHPYKDPPVKMTDNFYPSSQLKLVRTGNVMEHLLSTNILKYYAQDPAGNLSEPKTLVVLVKDREAPTMTLIGSTTIYLKRWQKFYEEGYIVIDNYDTFCKVEISGNFVNANTPGTYARIYKAIDKSGNISRYAMRIIHVEESTSSIEETDETDNFLKLYPNPASNNIYIQAQLDKTLPVQIFITDALGKTVKTIWQGNYKDAMITADIHDLTAGIYFVHFIEGDRKVTRKLIINK